MHRSRMAVLAAAALILVLATPALAITNGVPDEGRHPYVGILLFQAPGGSAWLCSGFLVSPRVVVTAGHCTYGATVAQAWFEENILSVKGFPQRGGIEGTPYTHPGFLIQPQGGLPDYSYRDVGVVELRKPVQLPKTDFAPDHAELPAPALVDSLGVKPKVDLVGYGATGKIATVWVGGGVRLIAETELLSGNFAWSSEYVRISQNPSGACKGDSGGPVLLHGSHVAIALDSYRASPNTCTDVAYGQRLDIPAVLEWIKSFMP